MLSGKAPSSVLVVSSSDKSVKSITELLEADLNCTITSAKSGGEARRLMISSSFEIAVINTPLSDEFGHELALYASDNAPLSVILLVKDEIFEEICHHVQEFGVFTISKPLSKILFHQALNLIIASQNKFRRIEQENRRLQTKLEETRVVARAKCILIEYVKMSEAQAHRYIEKQAMDLRISKRKVAENILKTYEY